MPNTFTPEQVTEILQIYFDNFVSQTYTGMRYVPIFGRRGESSIAWDDTAPYEPLTIVTYNDESYTSRQFVPAGAAITNTDYWVKTGAYNAQIAALQDALPIAQFDSENTVKDYVDELGSFLPASDFDNDNTVKAYIDGVANLLPSSAFDSVNTVRGALNGRVRAFETVADMIAANDLAADMICHTNGFHTSGDGGAAFYEITASGTANGMDVISCTGSSVYANLVITEPFVTPEQFGAYGDDTHDDTNAFTQAITKNTTIKTFNKIYLTSAPLLFDRLSNCKKRIENNGTINYSGNNYAIKIQDNEYTTYELGTIKAPNGGCVLVCNSNTSGGRHSVYVDIYFKQLEANTSTGSCVMFDVSNGLNYINDIRLYDGKFQKGQYGISYNPGTGNSRTYAGHKYTNCAFEGVTYGFGIFTTNIGFNICQNCRMEESVTKFAYLDFTPATDEKDASFIWTGNFFNAEYLVDVSGVVVMADRIRTVGNYFFNQPIIIFNNMYYCEGDNTNLYTTNDPFTWVKGKKLNKDALVRTLRTDNLAANTTLDIPINVNHLTTWTSNAWRFYITNPNVFYIILRMGANCTVNFVSETTSNVLKTYTTSGSAATKRKSRSSH